jgi:hypothetical protein
MTVEVSAPKSFIRYLKRLKNPQKQTASIEAIARLMKSPRDPKLNFERVVGRPGTFQSGWIMKHAFCCDRPRRIADMTP